MSAGARRRAMAAAAFLLAAALGIALLEGVGRMLIARARWDLTRDLDHRMEPYATPDLNGDGIRSAREAADFDPADWNLVFLGDSMTFGLHIEPEQALPQRVEALAARRLPERRVRVANFAWVSSSPLLSLRLLRDIGARYAPDVVVLAVDMTDIHDDLKYRALLERRGLFRAVDRLPGTVASLRLVVQVTPGLSGLHERLFGYPAERFFAVNRPLEETREGFAEIRRSIEATARFARDELGAHFVLLILPRCFQYSATESPDTWERGYEPMGPHVREPFRYFEELAHEVDFPVLSILEDFERADASSTCFDNDPHWTPLGSRIAARGVFRACRTAGCFGPPEAQIAPHH